MDSRSKTIAKNTIYLYIRTALMMLISLYTSRVILIALGETDFGIYNLVGGIVVLFSFINNSLVAATQRFLNYEIGLKNETGVTRVFSIAIVAHILVAIIIVLLAETVGEWLMREKVNIPPEKRGAAMIVYQISILTTVFSIIKCPFNASIIAYEKMSFFAWISIVESLLKLAVALIIKLDKGERLLTYAWLILGISVMITVLYWAYCHINLKSIKFRFISDFQLLKELLMFSIWNLLGNAANMVVNQGLGIIMNIFYGVLVNTAIGISNQLNAVTSSFVSNFQTAFMPQITKSYASKDNVYLNNLIIKATLISFLLTYILSVPLYSNCEYILSLWLGVVPQFSVEFTRIIILCTVVEAISGPLWMAVHATGKIRNYQIIVSVILLSSIAICYLICKLDLGAPLAYFSKVIVLLSATTFRLVYLCKVINFKFNQYLRTVIFRGIILILIAGVIICASDYIHNPIVKLICDICSILITSIMFGLPKEYKKYCIDMAYAKLRNGRS